MKAFIFTGQGNEYSQMAKELYENNIYAKDFIDNLNIDFDYKEVFVNESKLIHDTRYSQLGNFVFSIILAKLLNDLDINADVCAGLSLGEYTALCYANSISIEDTIKILEKRSNIMYTALREKDTGMYAIMFLDAKIIEKIVEGYNNVWIANYNSQNQIVISGDSKELEKCVKECLEKGAKKTVKLDVMGAFHSGMLKNNASLELKEVLNKYEIKRPDIDVYYNYIGDKSDEDIKDLLVKQLYSPVRFENIIYNMLKDGVDDFYVIGPGKSIDSFIRTTVINNKNNNKDNNKKIKINHIEKLKDLEKLIDE